jgi:hypothetical protein
LYNIGTHKYSTLNIFKVVINFELEQAGFFAPILARKYYEETNIPVYSGAELIAP